MFTAYVYKSTDIENACKRFLEENFKDTYIDSILDTLNCTEFVKDSLLTEEYLDGEILMENDHIAILITKFIDSVDIKEVKVKSTYPLNNA